MMKTLIGVFTDRDAVKSVIDKLREKNFDAKDVSIIMRDTREAEGLKDDTGADVAGGAISGITTGALLGGLAGLLAAFVIPGVGAFFIGGPIASALGLTGAAASTVSGAATGALAGGLIGALMGLGLSKDEAEHYENRIREGAILVAVPVTESNESYAQDVFSEYHATDVKSVTQSENETVRESKRQRTFADQQAPEDEDMQQSTAHAYHTAGAKGGTTSISDTANPVQIQKYLKGIDYPCSRNDLLETARGQGADESVINTLEQLPDREFESPRDVSKALGETE